MLIVTELGFKPRPSDSYFGSDFEGNDISEEAEGMQKRKQESFLMTDMRRNRF